MKVVATAKGYYGGVIREEGDEFVVDKGVTGSWFEPVADDHDKAEKPSRGRREHTKPDDEAI